MTPSSLTDVAVGSIRQNKVGKHEYLHAMHDRVNTRIWQLIIVFLLDLYFVALVNQFTPAVRHTLICMFSAYFMNDTRGKTWTC